MRTLLRLGLVVLVVLTAGLVTVHLASAGDEDVARSDSVTTVAPAPPAPAPSSTTTSTTPVDQTAAIVFASQLWEVEVLDYSAALYRAQLTDFVDALNAAKAADAQRAAAVRAPAPVARTAAPARPTVVATGGGHAANGFLECVKRRESGGNYSAYNPSGAAGAYQVMPGTWNGYGGYASAGQAPPAVQDAFAAQLYSRAGASPWAGGQYAC